MGCEEVIPSAFTVLRLGTSLNVLGCANRQSGPQLHAPVRSSPTRKFDRSRRLYIKLTVVKSRVLELRRDTVEAASAGSIGINAGARDYRIDAV
jgi:hypothetical protein